MSFLAPGSSRRGTRRDSGRERTRLWWSSAQRRGFTQRTTSAKPGWMGLGAWSPLPEKAVGD